ncbi:MAG TPA: VCBS repeat-containing protein [Phycisphaerae bacterium]|nr:VCBS repeat-containing protein [Phycisphaerae bacterium]
MSGRAMWLSVLLAGPPALGQGLAESLPARGNAWHIASGDVIGDSATEIVYACYDGAVCCQSTSDATAGWKYETRAFPYDLAVVDVDDDGKCEVLVASADGRLSCVGSQGSLRWTMEAAAPLYQVAVIRAPGGVRVVTGGVDRKLYVVDASGRLEKTIPWFKPIRLIRSGDLDGDQRPELVVASWSGEVQALRWPEGTEWWRRDLRRESTPGARPGIWFAHSLVIGDLEGDGPCELIFGTGNDRRPGVRVLSGDGSLRWETSEDIGSSDGGTMGHTAVALCNLGGPMGRQVVALDGRYLFLIDRSGRSWAKAAAPVSFTNLCQEEPGTAGSSVFLSSSSNGDDRVYRVRLEKGWEKSFEALRREGRMQRITDDLDRIRNQIMDYRGSAPAGPRYVQVVGFGSVATAPQLDSFFQLIAHYRRVLPYPNCVFAINVSANVEKPVPGFPSDGSTGGHSISSAQLIEVVRKCEKAEVPFIFTVAHGCLPWIPLDLVETIATEGRKSCLGFLSSEDDGNEEQVAHFLLDYWMPLMEICRRTGKKGVLVEKHAWWATVPAMKRFRSLFDGTYRDVLVMSVEDSNSRSPELNLMGRLGLYLSGCAEMSARTILDEMCWNRQWEWEAPTTGHPFLRRQIVQGLLGARYYEYMLPLQSYEWGRRGGFSVIGAESAELIIHMLGKGLLIPPVPSDMAGISPVMLRMREPNERFTKEAFNIHGHDSFVPDREENESPFEGLACHRGAAPVRPSYVGGYLLGIERHAAGFIPSTPFGIPALVPQSVERSRCSWAKSDWETDGRWWFEGTERRSGLEARSSVLQSFEQSALDLPLRVEGAVFMQVQKLGPDILRATLVDTGFLNPADRAVSIRVRTGLRVNKVVDLMSGTPLEVNAGLIALIVPAGAFRIIEFHGQF